MGRGCQARQINFDTHRYYAKLLWFDITEEQRQR